MNARIVRLEDRITPTCRTCYGYAYALVFVPREGQEADPEYRPIHCPECGVPLQNVTQIIGIDDQEAG